MCTISLIVNAKKKFQTETDWSGCERRTRSRPQTGFKEPDKAFIMLERFQDEAGAGRWARLVPEPAAERGDWSRWWIRGQRRGGALPSIKEGKLDREIYQNSSSWCLETLANICILVLRFFTFQKHSHWLIIFFALSLPEGRPMVKEFSDMCLRQGWGQQVQAHLLRVLWQYQQREASTMRTI